MRGKPYTLGYLIKMNLQPNLEEFLAEDPSHEHRNIGWEGVVGNLEAEDFLRVDDPYGCET